MNKRKMILRRLLRLILPLVLVGIILFCGARVERELLGPDMSSFYVRAQMTDVLVDYSSEEFVGIQKVTAVVTHGEHKGKTCELENPNSYHIGAYGGEGTRIVALVRMTEDGTLTGTVYNHDRTPMVYLLIGLFALATVLVGGKKGFATLYALAFTFLCVICMYIPLLYMGCNGILAAILTSVTILAASIYILNGWSVKTLCAILGTTLGVAVSGLFAMVIGRAFHLSGFNMDEVESLVYISNYSDLKIGDILYAGVLISSLGAVMDVSVSIVAALEEIRLHSPDISRKELFASGMRVGKDMIGTMSNTLILAYTGSATGIMMNAYANDMPYLRLMSYNSVVIEILCGLCGTIGVILTVPLQTLITVLVFGKKQQNKS
jgi:uncharacterized membrane protein